MRSKFTWKNLSNLIHIAATCKIQNHFHWFAFAVVASVKARTKSFILLGDWLLYLSHYGKWTYIRSLFFCEIVCLMCRTGILCFSVSAFQSTSAKLAFRWEMRVGSCIAWSMEFSPTVECPAIKPLEAAMTRSTLSSAKLVLENMCREQFLSIWNPLLSVSWNIAWKEFHPCQTTWTCLCLQICVRLGKICV